MSSRAFLKIPLLYTKFNQAYRSPLTFKVIHRELFSIPRGSEFAEQKLTRLYSSDGDTILEPESFEDNMYEEGSIDFSFRKILYLEDEPKLKALNECKSPQELLESIPKYKGDLQANHLVQSIILLWDFCRKTNKPSSNLDSYIKEHSSFRELLETLFKSIHLLNSNESTCCYLYLKRIGLEPGHKLLQQLLVQNLEKIKTDEYIPLTALSRFSVAVYADKNFNSSILCRNMMPHLMRELQKCTTTEEIRLITICFMNIRQLISVEILEDYKKKIKEMIKLKAINRESIKCILKILTFLNQPVWAHRNAALTRQLMLLILPNVEQMHENEIKAVFRIFQSQLEPADIVPKLLRVSEKLLEKHPEPEMLTCVVQFVEPKKREQLIDLFKKLLTDKSMWEHPSASLHFFTTLRSLKISDNSICDEYWSRVLNEIENNPDGKEHYIFSKHCHRYMYFNNNLGGTYRHIEFEKRLTQFCMNEINSGISAVIPSKFANIASFVIAYGHTFRGNMKLPNIIVSKIESMAGQFSIIDCLNLSRGIQIALEMRFRYFIPTTLASQLAIVEKTLDKCSCRHLNDLDTVDANNLNSVVRALNNRKASRKSVIFQRALNKYNDTKSNSLNSRLLRNMSFNLNSAHFVAPQTLEKMFSYIVKNEEYITGDTAEKILSCSYNLGYSPQLQDGLYSSAKTIMRDFDHMTGLSIIQACLALCFYKTIPEQLINKVFCVDFIKRIEEEIEMCYSKATYPERVLNQVMQLNRAVCLDFPEADVPWFQQNYLEAQLSKYPYVQNKYNDDVKDALMSVLKNESLFRCNHVTPYGYRIDFVIHFDNQKQPVPAPIETTVLDKITKVAILLLKLDSMCENDLFTLRGNEALKMRHLEMLGYKVVHINEADWIHIRGQDAKASYLNCLLRITS